LHDRLTHLFRLESSVSLHVLFGLAVTLIAFGRLAWRLRAGDRILRGGQRMAFTLVTLLGLWLLFGGGQVGGGISHR
jgi:cytochrome b561